MDLRVRGGSYVEGDIKSNELDKSDDSYMLLSLQAQATLGLVKDTQDGTCYLKEYKDYEQLYEAAGSGLRAICISDLSPPAPPVPRSVTLVPTKIQPSSYSSSSSEEDAV